MNKLTAGTYTTVFIDDTGNLLKVINDPKNNDLLAKEAAIIEKLKMTNLAELFPDLVGKTTLLMNALDVCDSCSQRFICFTTTVDRSNCTMKTNGLIYKYDADMPSLEDVMKAYPKGIDQKDMVWMFKRLLAALYTAHSIGVAHSAVLPEHVLLDLKTHGIHLIDWMHTNQIGFNPTIIKLAPDIYYPEWSVVDATTLDIHMAATCMVNVVGGIDNVDKDIKLILRACLSGATDAKLVHEQLDKQVKRLWGSVFRPFTVKK
jgi:hypothetical protein